jgi:hypothetical protein
MESYEEDPKGVNVKSQKGSHYIFLEAFFISFFLSQKVLKITSEHIKEIFPGIHDKGGFL